MVWPIGKKITVRHKRKIRNSILLKIKNGWVPYPVKAEPKFKKYAPMGRAEMTMPYSIRRETGKNKKLWNTNLEKSKNDPELKNKLVKHGIGPGAWKRLRYLVTKKYGEKCVSCNANSRPDIAHLVPYALSFDNSLDNLRPLCKRCHAFHDVNYFNPEFASWREQIRDVKGI